MWLLDLLLPVLVGLTAGILSGRSVRSLAGPRLQCVWLLWTAAVIQGAEYEVPVLHRLALNGGRPYFTVAIFGCVALCLWLNAMVHRGVLRAAWLAIGFGLVLNVIPLAANGTMPFSRRAALAAGMPPGKLDFVLVKNGVAHAGTTLPWLGDIIPVAWLHSVISIGDCAIAVGVAALVWAAMAPRPTAPTTAHVEGRAPVPV